MFMALAVIFLKLGMACLMATLSVKLVDHTPQDNNTATITQSVQKHLQALFDEVFNGTVHTVVVAWGTSSPTDALILHFVEDMDHSYIKQHMPGVVFRRRNTGGHTKPNPGGITGSEFYLYSFDQADRNARTRHNGSGCAQLAFHEGLHNQFPAWSEDDMHNNGGGGLASRVVGHALTERNKELMRRGLPIKNAQLL